MVLGVCGVVSSITTALSHPLIASFIGCAMCGDCMVLCCLIECGLSALTVTHKERGQHTGVFLWCVMCVMVWCGLWCVSESVEEEWWHGGLKRGERVE